MRLRDLYPNRFFLHVWRDADEEATRHRAGASGSVADSLTVTYVFVVVAISLTLQDYFGGPDTFYSIVGFIDNPLSAHNHPVLWSLVGWLAPKSGVPLYLDLEASGYLDLWNLAYWACWRVFGFLVVPVIAIAIYPAIAKLVRSVARLFARRANSAPDAGQGEPAAAPNPFGLAELGLSLRGFSQHVWVYGVLFAPVLVAVVIVSFTEEFSTYYPFYSEAHRSLFDFVVWEAFYIAQFFALEFFFRGFMIQPLRKVMGSSAIFAMMIPYVMIHYGKPILECFAAIIAGVVLGTLAMRTRSIWAGFLIHVSVALSMDIAAIWQTHW